MLGQVMTGLWDAAGHRDALRFASVVRQMALIWGEILLLHLLSHLLEGAVSAFSFFVQLTDHVLFSAELGRLGSWALSPRRRGNDGSHITDGRVAGGRRRPSRRRWQHGPCVVCPCSNNNILKIQFCVI